jgi:hypothetical protein
VGRNGDIPQSFSASFGEIEHGRFDGRILISVNSGLDKPVQDFFRFGRAVKTDNHRRAPLHPNPNGSTYGMSTK